jgi:plastocyanin
VFHGLGTEQLSAPVVLPTVAAFYLRTRLLAVTALPIVLTAACGNPMPSSPTPTPTPTMIANAYILPGAVSLNDRAFGDEPVVIHPHERLRWVNVDTLTHRIVADTPDATDFRNTNDLRPGDEQSFDMTRLGTTRIHCANHPNMTGTLIVRE